MKFLYSNNIYLNSSIILIIKCGELGGIDNVRMLNTLIVKKQIKGF